MVVLLPVAPPVIPPVTVGRGHEYVVPIGTNPLVVFVGDTVKPAPLHAEAVIVVIAGVGLTVKVTVNVLPVQLPANGVTM